MALKTYKVSDLINKPLILKVEVPVYRNRDEAKPVYMARAGQSAGIVYSWVTSKKTGDIWLMFFDANKKPYYINTKDLKGKVDTTELKREGVKTSKEVEKEAEKKAAPVEFYLKKYGPWFAGGIVALIILKRALK